MSKAVHWQVPFCSLKGVQYRVDIYDDDYTGSPVQLTGGATPFVTDEDNDDNFFAPVRTQTGQLTVIDMDGTLMETLIPSDNTARPVRLIRVSDSTVMWQGFLSCEAYSQDYTSRAQELTLNVNSVLAAMESVKVGDDLAGFKTIKQVLMYVFNKTKNYITSNRMVGVYYIPNNAKQIMDKYIDTTVMFDKKEQSSESHTTYISVGISCKDVLERICTYMGWTAREERGNVVFQSSDCDEVVPYTPADSPMSVFSKSTVQMSEQEWRGTGHRLDYAKGAKSVEVVAKVGDFKMEIDIPECPAGDMKTMSGNKGEKYYYYALNKVQDAYSNITHVYRYSTVDQRSDAIAGTVVDRGTVSMNNLLDNLSAFVSSKFIKEWDEEDEGQYGETVTVHVTENDYYTGSFLARYAISDEQQTIYKTKDCLMVFMRERNYGSGDLFRMRSTYMVRGGEGIYLKVDIQAAFFAYVSTIKESLDEEETKRMYIRMKVGDKYFNPTSKTWSTSESGSNIDIAFDKSGMVSNWDSTMPFAEEDGYFIPVTAGMLGNVEIQIMDGHILGRMDAIGINSINVSIKTKKSSTVNERSENKYFQLINAKFSDEVSVSTDIASDMNNVVSPSVLSEDSQGITPMTQLQYTKDDGTSYYERPEKHLLNRLAAYYGAVRRKITLEIDRPSNPLPLTKVTGYDNRTYLPLAESRDWRMDKSTVTMYETT